MSRLARITGLPVSSIAPIFNLSHSDLQENMLTTITIFRRLNLIKIWFFLLWFTVQSCSYQTSMNPLLPPTLQSFRQFHYNTYKKIIVSTNSSDLQENMLTIITIFSRKLMIRVYLTIFAHFYVICGTNNPCWIW